MANPLTVARNNYHKNPKRSDIPTPLPLAQFIYQIVSASGFVEPGIVVDVGCGDGNLSIPFFRDDCFRTVGIDIVDSDNRQGVQRFIQADFLKDEVTEHLDQPVSSVYGGRIRALRDECSLVVCNPPFNTGGTKSRKLMPEVFMHRIFELFREQIPLVLFTPMGMLLNQRMHSRRWQIMRDMKAEVSSQLSLPLNVFEGVEFHSVVLFFNIPDLEGHYFLPEDVVEEIKGGRN